MEKGSQEYWARVLTRMRGHLNMSAPITPRIPAICSVTKHSRKRPLFKGRTGVHEHTHTCMQARTHSAVKSTYCPHREPELSSQPPHQVAYNCLKASCRGNDASGLCQQLHHMHKPKHRYTVSKDLKRRIVIAQTHYQTGSYEAVFIMCPWVVTFPSNTSS